MRRLLPLILITVTLTSAGFARQPVGAQGGGQVWAYYMGFWFGQESWGMQGDVLQDRPTRGLYDQRDPSVVGAHINEAMATGIDAFIVNWRNTNQETEVVNRALEQASARGFEIGVAIDSFSGFQGLSSAVNFIVNEKANHPAYLRYNGKPVIFFAFQQRLGLSAGEWQTLRNQIDPNRRTIWMAEGLSGCCIYGGAMDGMYAFNLVWDNSAGRFNTERTATFNAGGSFYIPTIHPGWDENAIAVKQGRTNPAAPVDRAGGGFLAGSFNNAVSTGTDVVLVVSWNEFVENSHIEPSTTYGTQSLDTLRPLITGWKGRAPSAPTNVNTNPVLPASSIEGPSVQADTLVYVRPDPSTNGEPLGTISPGAAYALLSESPGWYGIDYNGQTGYVSAQYSTASGSAPATAPQAPVEAAAPVAPPVAPAATTLSSGTLEPLNYVYVRPDASTNGAPLGMIEPGQVFTVVSEGGGWYGIDYNGQTGYVAANYVRVGGAAPAIAATGSTTITLTFVANMRAAPNTGGDVLGVAAGDSVWQVTGRTADGAWLRVNFQGKSGWVSTSLGTVNVDMSAVPVVE